MGKEKRSLGVFHKEASRQGLTYAEAQIQESREMMGRIRAPRGEEPDEVLYQKVSARNQLRKLHKSGQKG